MKAICHIILLINLIKPAFPTLPSSSSSSSPELSLFKKLEESQRTVCPPQSDGSANPKPQCTELSGQLSEMRDSLIAQSLTEAAEGISELSNPSGSSSSSSSSSSSTSDGGTTEGRNCSSNVFGPILNKLKELKTKLQSFNFKEHYFVLFIFTSVIMILLLISQTYHCCVGHLKDRRIRLAQRETQRASNLYHNMQRIHRQGTPLLQVNSQSQGTTSQI